MFERYSETARRAIFFARYEASQTGSDEITTEHLLLGILRAAREAVLRLLGSQHLVDQITREVKETFPATHEKIDTSVDLPLDSPCKRVLEHANEEAERLHDRHIGPEHLLLGILREAKTAACRVLRTAGVDLNTARRKVEAEKGGKISTLSAAAPSSAADLARVGQADGCVEFVCDGVRVGVTALGLVHLLPRQGELVVMNDVQMGVRGFRVRELTHYYESNPPGVVGAPHRLTKVVVYVVRAEPGSSQPFEAT